MGGFLGSIGFGFEGNGLISLPNTSQLMVAFIGLNIAHGCAMLIYNLYFHPLRNIPGPLLWLAFPALRKLSMTRGIAEFQMRSYHEKHGDVMRIAPDEVSFTAPPAWKDIYGHGHKEFPKYYPPGYTADPRRVISSNASDHFRYRRAMLPAFSDKALLQQEPLIQVYVDMLIEKLGEVSQGSEPTDMVRWYNLTTFDLIADLAFGKSLLGLAEGRSNGWIDSIAMMIKMMPLMTLMGVFPIFSALFKLILGPKIASSRRDHLAKVRRMAENRIQGLEQKDRGDFMDFMMRSRGQPHEMTDEELVVNADLLMVAGSETTATLLSGATYYLLKTPHALMRVTEEVRKAFHSSSDITFNEARTQLPYMIACLDEALRMFPPSPLNMLRIVPDGPPVEVAGVLIPEKMKVGVHQLSAMHSEHNFYRAHEYIPERWLPESTKDPLSPFYDDRRDAHRPFSFGPRDCIGRNLAYHEMRLIMAKVLWNFDLSLHEQCKNWHNQKIFALWSKPELKVYIRPRFT